MRVTSALAGVAVAGMLTASACATNKAQATKAGTLPDPENPPSSTPYNASVATGPAPSPQAGEQASAGMGAGAAAETAPGQRQFAGRVIGIDRQSSTLTLDNGAMIAVGSDATFKKDGRSASFGDIRPGDEIRASFAPGSRVLEGFTVTSPSPSRGQGGSSAGQDDSSSE